MNIKSGSLPLTPGATLIAYYETTLTSDLVNIAKTSGTPVYDITGTAISGMTKPVDSDTAEARAVTPGLSIVKMVYDGHDSGAQSGSKKHTGTISDNITYIFTIKNTSDTFLKDITLTDNGISIGGFYLTNGGMTLKAGYNDTVPLAKGETLVYYYETTLTGDLFNTVSVIGTPCNSSGVDYAGAPKPTDADYAEVEIESTIGDTVWYDIDGDGVMNGSETGIPGVVVRLYKGAILLEQTTTDAFGWYLFDKLPSGTYKVKVVPGSELVGYKQTYDLDGTLDNEADRTIGTSMSALDVDFGYEPIPHLTLTKTVDKAYVKRGETVVYSLTVLNDGKTDLTNIRISDAAVGIDITILSLVSNASITKTVAFVIPAGAPLGPWVNIADAWSDTTITVTDDAITTVYKPSSPPPVVTPPVITPPVDPPVLVPDEGNPSGPGDKVDGGNLGLPKTGGTDQVLLYGTGFLLMLLGLILLRRGNNVDSRRRKKRA
jgi:LPXTG-motif cell wall-anchored protein